METGEREARSTKMVIEIEGVHTVAVERRRGIIPGFTFPTAI
jgi:hypothetical protein